MAVLLNVLLPTNIPPDNDPVPDLVAQLSQEIYYNNVLEALILNLSRLDFEACFVIDRAAK